MALQFNINKNNDDKKNDDKKNNSIVICKKNDIKKPKKLRCSFVGCRKKLTLLDLECKCKNKYCLTHRLPENHNCTYDFKTEGKIAIEKNNPVVVNDKLIKI